MSTNYYGETPFHIAAKENKMDIIMHYKHNIHFYTMDYHFHVDYKASDGWSAVMFAAVNTNITIVTFLVTEM